MVCLQSLHSVGVVTISFHIFHIYPIRFVFFGFLFFYWSASCLLYVLWISSIYFAYNITWFALCILFPFSFLLLHGVYIVGIMGFVWWGVLFCCICTTTSLSISCSPYNVYSSIFFCLVLYAYFFFHISPYFCFFSLCVCFVHTWMKTFGGCMHMHHMQLCMSLEICMLNILCYNLIPLARIVMLSM